MSDNRTGIAGSFGKNFYPTALLEEGAITLATGYDPYGGRERTIAVGAAPLHEGEPAALVNSSENTFAATHGNILVEVPQNGESLVLGRIGTPEQPKTPASASLADTLTKRLSGGYLRTSGIEFLFQGIVKKVTVKCDGSNPTIPGIGTTLKLDITDSQDADNLVFVQCASGGTGVIPLHYVPAGTAGDTYDCAVIMTGLVTSLT